jgi:hypothetical protein
MRRRQKGFRKDRYNKTSSARKKFHRSYGSAKIQEISPVKLLEQEILAYLYQKKEPQSMSDILSALSLSRSDRKKLSHLLADMCRQDIISCPKSRKAGKFYTLRKEDALVEGVVEVHPRGFGFAIIGDKPGSLAQKTDKSF